MNKIKDSLYKNKYKSKNKKNKTYRRIKIMIKLMKVKKII